MARQRRIRTPPLMSSAGIMRYFEEERTQIRISPKTVLITGVLSGVLIVLLNAYYGLWP